MGNKLNQSSKKKKNRCARRDKIKQTITSGRFGTNLEKIRKKIKKNTSKKIPDSLLFACFYPDARMCFFRTPI